MSNKTIFKRVSLVAITALGAGILSAVPASAGNNTAVGGANVATAAGILNIATKAAITADVTLSASGSGVGSTSVGLLANSTTITTSSLTSTATMRSDGKIVFYYTAVTAGAAVTAEIVGGTITAASQAAGSNVFNASRTQVVTGPASAAAAIFNFAVAPSSGSTSMTVSLYETAAAAADNGDAAAILAISSGSVSRGSLKQRYVVTVATTSVSGAYSAGDSLVNTVASASTAATGVDETGSSTIANSAASVGYIAMDLYDAYGVSLDGLGALVISGTNGAGIAYAGASSAGTPTNVTAVSTDTSGTITVARPTAFAGKGFSTTVTISWNGVVVGTKSFTFQGEVASMVVTPRRVGSLGATSTDAFRVTYADSAGNALIGLGTSATTAVSSTLTSVVTGASIGTQGTTTDAAKGSITCASGSSAYLGGGTASIQLQHVNSVSGTTVKSNVFAMSCQGNAYSYTAGFDRAVYTPGSIATLTITLKDRDGDLANGYDTWAASNVATITGGPSATAVAIPATGDKADGGTGLQGIKTYQFVVGSTEGDFQAVVSVADVNSRNSSQANQTVAYSVKSATTSVSNADVLKSIVALIASINKQIQALQKLILKR